MSITNNSQEKIMDRKAVAVTRSDKDETFGFFKRPTKARLV